VKREVLISSPWYPVIGRKGMVQSCIRVGLDLTFGNTLLLRERSHAVTDFLERGLMPQACQCLKGIWTMPFITCFNFWAALKWFGSRTK